MRAGKLNRRVTIQRRESGYDEAGQPVDTWADAAEVWADVAGKTGFGAMRDA